MPDSPRVTLGIATYNRDTYLAEAIESCLSQDYESLEVLVVIDGAGNRRIDEIVSGYSDDPRLRVVRHPQNLGISAAYNTFVSEGRGELIAMLGDDDVCLPGRIRRQVELFDRYQDTGVVHGDAIVIDGAGTTTGAWNSTDFTPTQLIHCFYRNHDYIVDPSRMVHRSVYERIGGYDLRYKVAQDFEFWLRAGQSFRFRHCDGGPLIKLRRHGDNGSDESQRAAETAEVALALSESLERYTLRELEPELDWSVLDPLDAQRQALLRLADQVGQRQVPVPTLATELRERAARISQPQPSPRNGRRLLMTMFGWDDSGGGTILPRLIAKELARRGWEVSVFHAATKPLVGEPPYATRAWVEDGVRLVGVHNRPSFLFDIQNPLRELDDPAIRSEFRKELDHFQPDVVHFHNLHNLGASLIDDVAAHGIRSYFTTHNYWLICPRAYLMRGSGEICDGPGDGARCAKCTGSNDPTSSARRLAGIRSRVLSGVTRVLAISDSVRRTLLSEGYIPGAVDVVRQAMPHERDIWEAVGIGRQPGRRGGDLTVAFLGSAYPHKGPQLLVEAAQRTQATVRVRIIGEVPTQFAQQLRQLDRRGVTELTGSYSPSELPSLLAKVDAAALPSTWWDCANLAAEECHAARLPLLVPRLGGLAETVSEEVDGLTFAGLDVDDLARQLDRLASEPGLLERLQAGIAPPAEFSAHVDELETYYYSDPPTSPASDVEVDLTDIAVRWKGDHGLPTSLSIVNDAVTGRLPHQAQRIAASGKPLDAPLPRVADIEVRHQWPPDFTVPGGGTLATIVPWEFGSVPADWVKQITENVDELWVPSEYVRAMYVQDGVDAARVVVIPNGVDLDVFHPAGPWDDARHSGPTRFLYVGGITYRKAPEVLLRAWDEAFPGRDDVILVVKAAMAQGAYGELDAGLRARAGSSALPRVELITDDLDTHALADLYRSSDVFVLPYRGEGFAMPVLEAMACGLPVITTAGGPTDEFCPPDAGWRIRSSRRPMPLDQLTGFTPVAEPWMLEPDKDHLVELLRSAASDPEARRARGLSARAAAEALSWDTVASRYDERLRALTIPGAISKRALRAIAPFPLPEQVQLRILATPAWRGVDRLTELLREWSDGTTPSTPACLYLLADPAVAGEPDAIEQFIVEAAERADVDLDSCADINILMEPFQADRDARLHRSVNAYVVLHAGCAGHSRLAQIAGNTAFAAGDGMLSAWVSAQSAQDQTT